MERTYNVPLRKGFQKVPHYRRAKKAVKTLKEFIKQHMKADSLEAVKVQKELNEHLWKHGIRKPPHHVKVTAKKEEGKVLVNLEGVKASSKKDENSSQSSEKKTGPSKQETKADSKAADNEGKEAEKQNKPKQVAQQESTSKEKDSSEKKSADTKEQPDKEKAAKEDKTPDSKKVEGFSKG